MKANACEYEYDINVKDLQKDGILIPYDQFEADTVEILKCLMMDAAACFVTGLCCIPKEELTRLKAYAEDEPDHYRPVWPIDAKTGLEMAGFLNSYLLRYPDLSDTLRMVHAKLDAGGHPSDLMATIFTMCDEPGVNGKRIMECINVGYQMWYLLQNGMLTDRNLDCSTALAFVTPVIAALCKNDGPERIQNALNLSVAGGIMLGRVRSTDDMTNLKSAAAGFATAKGFWSYRLSDVIEAPATIFTGNRGSWFKVVGPIDRPFKGIDQKALYQMIELKAFPCFNVGQAPVECGIEIHNQLHGNLSRIKKITLRKSVVEARMPFRSDRPKYPTDHPTADHHIEYCVNTAIIHGSLTPTHFGDNYIADPTVRRLIDMTELKVFTEDELTKIVDGNTGGCSLTVELDDGTVLTEVRKHAAGNVIGIESSERVKIMRGIVARKWNMVRECYGYDLSPVGGVMQDFENRPAADFIDALRQVIAE